jgi:hypothetical protein
MLSAIAILEVGCDRSFDLSAGVALVKWHQQKADQVYLDILRGTPYALLLAPGKIVFKKAAHTSSCVLKSAS